MLRGVALLFALTAAAWVLWQFGTAKAATAPDTPFLLRVLDTILGDVTVLGLVTLAIGLIPLRFLHGHVLWQWRPLVWLPVYVCAGTAFTLLLIGPKATGASPGSIAKALWLFIGFCVGSFLFWAFFALRRRYASTATLQRPQAQP